MMRTAVAGLVATLGSLAAVVPAQAAPPSTISQAQVEQTTNRATMRGPYRTKFGVTIELRAILADPNYRFSACLQRGSDYDCTSEW
jgi:hypothetical protein